METDKQSIVTIEDITKYCFNHTLHGSGFTYVERGEVLRLISELRLALENEKLKTKTNV